MKLFILFLMSITLIFASNSTETKTKACSVSGVNITHTQRMEKRVCEIQEGLKEKEKERLQKTKIREEKIQNLDKSLKEKAKKRQQYYDSQNHSTFDAIKKEILAKKELDKANS